MFCGPVNGVLRILNDPSQNRSASLEGSVVWLRTSILWIKSWVLFLALKPTRCGYWTASWSGLGSRGKAREVIREYRHSCINEINLSSRKTRGKKCATVRESLGGGSLCVAEWVLPLSAAVLMALFGPLVFQTVLRVCTQGFAFESHLTDRK